MDSVLCHVRKCPPGSKCGQPAERFCTTRCYLLSELILPGPWELPLVYRKNVRGLMKLIPQHPQGLSSPRGFLKWGPLLDRKTLENDNCIIFPGHEEEKSRTSEMIIWVLLFIPQGRQGKHSLNPLTKPSSFWNPQTTPLIEIWGL